MKASYRFGVLLIISLLIVPTAILLAQIEEQVEVELVQIDLTATDSKGNPIRDLKPEEIVVKEEGKQQTLSHFYNSADEETRFPLTLSFLVDTSGSMEEAVGGMTRLDIAVAAAEMIVEDMKEDDQVDLIEFNEKAQEVVPFTNNIDKVLDGLESLKFQKKGTALHDSFIYSLDKIKDKSGRKIIVVFSDGMDTGSSAIFEDVMDAIRKSDTTIISFYSENVSTDFLSPGEDMSSMRRVRVGTGEDNLKQYSDMSGGQFFPFQKEKELMKAMDGLRTIVNSQYTLSYKPIASAKSGFRKIKVECKRKGVKLRYREGYWAG